MARQNLAQAAYRKVKAIREKHPDKSLGQCIKEAKVTSGQYSYGRQQVEGIVKRTGKVKKPRYEQMAPAQPSLGKIPVIFCTPEQIKELFQ